MVYLFVTLGTALPTLDRAVTFFARMMLFLLWAIIVVLVSKVASMATNHADNMGLWLAAFIHSVT